jgi:multidrug efflux pump subunit AcrB
MKLPKLAIQNYQFTLIVILILVLTGIVSFITMPRSEDPQISGPGTSVFVIYPGANPVDVERLITDPIEETVNELDDIKEIRSFMRDGLSVTHIEFLADVDMDKKYADVVQKVNSIRNELPDDIMSLKFHKWEISDVNILQLAMVSPSASYKILEDETERLKKRLEKISGVRRVKTWALPKQEIRVALNLERMVQTNISFNQVLGSIQSANMNIPGGSIDIGMKKFNIQTSGNYVSIDDIKNTIIHSDGTKIVHLKDVADIFFDYEDNNYFARYNKQRAIYLTVNQKERTNIFNIMDDLKEKIIEFEKEMPPSITLHTAFDQSQSVAKRMNNFFLNLLEGVILVGIVIFLSLSLRASMIVILAIPVSILIGIGFVDMSGYGLEQMSIAGLVIVLGILVDNAIVVTENVSRFLKMDYSFIDSAVEGTNQIAWAIVSATATTVLAFVPIMMMGEVTGDFIRSMPVTVVYTLTASLLVALTLTPFLSSRLLKIERVKHESKIQKLLNYIIEMPYRKTLKYALSNGKIILIFSLIIFIVSLALFPIIGVSFFPKAEKPQFIINIDTPNGSSLERTDQATKFVENLLASRIEIDRFAANIGRGNPRVYYNVLEKQQQSNYAQIFVQLKNSNLKEMAALISDLRHEFSNYPGAIIKIKELEQGPPVEAPIAIKVLGRKFRHFKRDRH